MKLEGIGAIDPARAWSSLASLLAGPVEQIAIVAVNDSERAGFGAGSGTTPAPVSDLPRRLLPNGAA